MNPIINSRTDVDAYKFSMGQVVFHNYTDVSVRYKFTCRTPNVDLTPFINEIREQIDHLKNLTFDPLELQIMQVKMPWIQQDFIQYLSNSKLNPKEYVKVYQNNNVPGGISIDIEGPWLDTIWFEIPILAIISELYMRSKIKNQDAIIEYAIDKMINKMDNAQDKYHWKMPGFVDFGTRRRAFKMLQEKILETLGTFPCYLGTSNVSMGIKYNQKIFGTIAHEMIMAHAAFTCFDLSQKMALDVWQKEYRDQLGIVLTDTYTTDFFLKDFDKLFASTFSGVRQDSGDPFVIGEKIIEHYQKLGIDPYTKSIVFSDGLDFNKMVELHKYFQGRIKAGFGIGTSLTNDIGIQPLNIVIKLSHAKRGNEIWHPLIKISDSPGKTMCEDKDYERFILKVVNQRVSGEA